MALSQGLDSCLKADRQWAEEDGDLQKVPKTPFLFFFLKKANVSFSFCILTVSKLMISGFKFHMESCWEYVPESKFLLNTKLLQLLFRANPCVNHMATLSMPVLLKMFLWGQQLSQANICHFINLHLYRLDSIASLFGGSARLYNSYHASPGE